MCHCFACQRRTGSAFGLQASFAKDDVHVSGEASTYLRVGDEGSRITFSFCAICGATVHYAIEGREQSLAVAVGAFADPRFPAPSLSVYEERMHHWLALPPQLQHVR
jgi:hypothetical protein